MDDLQQRILEIASQIPGYLGYEAKERRRDMDKYTRGTLSHKYNELHAALARIRAKAPLENAVDLENLDQKLLRLIARFQTAPRGYAGWFDAAQIVEEDLDALTNFDAELASGVPGLKSAIDKVAAAIKSREGIADAVEGCATTLDTLNARFDEREQFLATGKKPSMTILPNRPAQSPLGALETKKTASPELLALTNLKLNDAVSYDNNDFIVSGKITYTISTGSFWAFLLQDGKNKAWLRVGPGEELSMCKEIKLDVSSPLPETIEHDKRTLTRNSTGQAKVSVEGAGGTKRGTVDYARYVDADARLWAENFGTETRVMYGQTIDSSELKVYRK
ncbi:MAG: DUF4178 domain-containing protein [Chloroflexi bacterium]|nr:DUF4178 domain-containing protein [Chloroflexota bacterium]